MVVQVMWLRQPFENWTIFSPGFGWIQFLDQYCTVLVWYWNHYSIPTRDLKMMVILYFFAKVHLRRHQANWRGLGPNWSWSKEETKECREREVRTQSSGNQGSFQTGQLFIDKNCVYKCPKSMLVHCRPTYTLCILLDQIRCIIGVWDSNFCTSLFASTWTFAGLVQD